MLVSKQSTIAIFHLNAMP